MIRINQVKVRAGHTKEQLLKKAAELLQVSVREIKEFHIVRQSIDARRKPEIFYSYVLDVQVQNEDKVLRSLKKKRNVDQISKIEPVQYQFPESGNRKLKSPIVIVGMGPAGLFCGYYLALHGYRPIILERGEDVDSRKKSVEAFWNGGKLLPNSNVQFGEGGAGTFSDGKLNTLVKDKSGRNKEVLNTFIRFGAKESILYEAKPHIGTDVLSQIVKRMREEIIRLGGQVRFGSQVTDIEVSDNRIEGVIINGEERLACSQLVLAIGHSARDTFSTLYDKGLPMEAKAFAVGFRVEHPQKDINRSQYGTEEPGSLGAAPYKVTAKTQSGRGVYSFCMCPGGYVVNASSEEGRLAVNGMSYSGRDGSNANSAIIVAVTPEDFGSKHPLSGIAFQRTLEERTYNLASGKIPVQRYGEFKERVEARDGMPEQLRKVSPSEQSLEPQCKGLYAWSDLTGILPKECNEAFVEGMECFGRQIAGFNSPEAIMSGVESRTSSPVRIIRDEALQSVIRGVYPCGEGAGYAGGITSAAMDGLRVAEVIAAAYAPVLE
ncbi:MAG: FAD-dependent oxidoreductase [Lachnospiraceae bacterium]|nr:FAD-dependent oxidoreductase [Lachnospiraceae bacterium]